MALVCRNVSDVSPDAGPWEKSPGIPASEIASKPALNLDDPHPHRLFSTTDATIANGKLSKDLGRLYDVRALDLQRWNGSQRAQIRTVLDDRWARRWYIGLSGLNITSTADITVSASYTVELWVRLSQTWDLTAKAIAFLGTADAAATRDWRLTIASSGLIIFRSNRHLAGNVNATGTTALLDRDWHHIVATFDDGTDELKLYVDLVLEDTVTEPKALPVATTDMIGLGGAAARHWDFGDVRLWNRALSLGELQDHQSQLLTGFEADLELAYQFEEGTGNAIADTTGNHAGTATGSPVWDTWLNPVALHDVLAQRWGPWSRRRFIRYDGVADLSRTAAALDSNVSVGVAFWVRFPSTINTTTSTFVMSFGSGNGVTNQDWFITITETGLINFVASRYTSFNALQWPVTLLDDQWHRLVASIDGLADTMSFYVDGDAHASNGASCDPFVLQTGTEFLTIAASPVDTQFCRVDMVGDMIIRDVTMTPADDLPYERFTPENDLTIQEHYVFEEGTGDEEVLIVNRGETGTDGDLTLAASAGTPDWTGFVDALNELPVVLPATELPNFVPGVEDDDSRPPVFVERLAASVRARFVAADIFDPGNANGVIEIGTFSIWECSDETVTGTGSAMTTIPPRIQWSPAGAPRRSRGVTARRFRASFAWLTQAPALEVAHWARRSMELDEALLFILAHADEDRVFWALRSVYGVPIRSAELQDRRFGTNFHGFDLTVREIPSIL